MADPSKTKQARSPLDRADSNIPFQDWQRLVTRPAGEEKRLARGFSVADGVGDLGTMRNSGIHSRAPGSDRSAPVKWQKCETGLPCRDNAHNQDDADLPVRLLSRTSM
jgi:hypothetical protein